MKQVGSPVPGVHRDIRRRLTVGSTWAFLGRLLGMAGTFVLMALLARVMTPQEFGAYVLGLSIILGAALIPDLGMPQAIVRFIAEGVGTGRTGIAVDAAKIGFGLSGATGLVVAALLASDLGRTSVVTVFDSRILATALVAAASVVLAKLALTLVSESFRGFHDILRAVMLREAAPPLLGSLTVLYVWLRFGSLSLTGAFLILAVATALPALVGGVLLVRRFRSLDHTGRLPPSAVVRVGAPLGLNKLVLFVMGQVDLWILAAVVDEVRVGVYGVALKLVQFVVLPLYVINQSVPPTVAELYARSELGVLQRVLRLSAGVAFWPAFAAFAFLLIAGRPLIEFAFGDAYGVAYTPLVILAIGRLASVYAGSCGASLVMTGHERAILFVSIVGGVLTVGIAWTLVAPLGEVGAAMAATIGLALQNWLAWLVARRRIGISTHADVVASARSLVRMTLRR
jgi:O-antigen/teichoic acid export membrane protein